MGRGLKHEQKPLRKECFRGRANSCVGPGGSGWVCRGQGSRVGEGQGGCEVEGVGRGPAGPDGEFGI